MTHDTYHRGCGCSYCNGLYERWLAFLNRVRLGATNNARLAIDLAASDADPPLARGLAWPWCERCRSYHHPDLHR